MISRIFYLEFKEEVQLSDCNEVRTHAPSPVILKSQKWLLIGNAKFT